MRANYDRPGIVRAFEHHSVEGRTDFAFIGQVHNGLVVRLHDEVVTLTNREAWLVANALSAGRNIGARVAADPTVQPAVNHG